ncbi:hypothetical protein [Photobacterium lutimaris]|uniref:Uncharacterized protein n=1 Tax=Photobacterium lutimaris TaxID=388278 RepID=A0A2T3ITP1_9GAMM|nr:hypothetical protein [Photobacterium lutimaris]PSU31718.1 hypothetical protein C9I99_21260 [Photobacterium lutimaris]TDR72643.1 hypothetical protein DFP78_113119 [Photobacterium lutimaris]
MLNKEAVITTNGQAQTEAQTVRVALESLSSSPNDEAWTVTTNTDDIKKVEPAIGDAIITNANSKFKLKV